MKLKDLLTAIIPLFIISCNDVDSELTSLEPPKTKVQFTVLLNQKTEPFPETRSMPPLDIPEPQTKQSGSEGEQDVTDLCTRIEYVVYESDQLNTVLKQESFVRGVDDDFGIIYDALPEGEYTIAIVAHSSTEASVAGQIISFNNKLSDTFHQTCEIAVSGTEPVNKTITLRRVVSKILFKSTEAVPQDQNTFSIEVDDFPGKLNLLTGHGLASDNLFEYSHSFTDSDKGKENTTYDFLCFDPDKNATMQVTLTSTNTSDEITCTWDIDVDPKANQMISYSGRLYSPNANNDNTILLEIENNGDWGDTIDKELE